MHDARVNRSAASLVARRAIVVGALGVLGACSSSSSPSSTAGTPGVSAAPTDRIREVPDETFPLRSAYNLYTHCGVRFIYYEDEYYRARRMPSGTRPNHAPPGWDDPEQRGTLTAFDEEHVRFKATGLPSVDYYRTSQRPPACADR